MMVSRLQLAPSFQRGMVTVYTFSMRRTIAYQMSPLWQSIEKMVLPGVFGRTLKLFGIVHLVDQVEVSKSSTVSIISGFLLRYRTAEMNCIVNNFPSKRR
jgi:hypothetical protein